MESIDKVLLKRPAGIRVGEFIFRETAYGVVKRLRFFVEHIERERARMGLSRNECRILDVGCGTGTYVTIPLAEMGYTVVGVDTDQASIDRARENAALVGAKGLALHCGRVGDLHLGSFQVVICSEVLEHQPHPECLLRELRTMLVEKGLLLVTVPNGYGYYELESCVSRVVPRLPVWIDTFERLTVRLLGTPSLKRRHRSEYGGVSLLFRLVTKFHSLNKKSKGSQNDNPFRVKAEADRRRNAIEQSSLAADGHHDQHFTAPRVRQLIMGEGYTILGFRNNTILAGNMFNA